MIGTLLEVYRYDCGNVKLFVTKFDLVDLLKESINQIKSLAEDKKIQINVNSSHDNIIINADKRDVKRLTHNLVSNAINHGIHRGFLNCSIEVIHDTVKYVPKSDTEYYTSLRGPVEITNSVLVSIEDNGVGINREDMPLLFNRFSLSKGRKPAGSGLGLYYASQVVKLHGGHIWAESSETGGSTFKFTLPLEEEVKDIY
jgi:signal transduction histidine kinase